MSRFVGASAAGIPENGATLRLLGVVAPRTPPATLYSISIGRRPFLLNVGPIFIILGPKSVVDET